VVVKPKLSASIQTLEQLGSGDSLRINSLLPSTLDAAPSLDLSQLPHVIYSLVKYREGGEQKNNNSSLQHYVSTLLPFERAGQVFVTAANSSCFEDR